jgi:hypothetical protein
MGKMRARHRRRPAPCRRSRPPSLACCASGHLTAQLAGLGEREQRQSLMLAVQLFGTGRRWRPLPEALDLLW